MKAMSESLGSRLAAIKGAKLIKSFCYTCPWQCPTEVLVRDGRIVYQKGNSEAPNNIGARCAKGMASWWVSRDPDRLQYPMLRTNPKGQPGTFRRASWDEAFEFIASKLKSIRDQWGPEALALTCHHDPNTQFYRHLLGELYGSPNMYTHTSGCEQDRRSACLTLFGHVFPMHDFANSKYVILWGMNMLGANQGLWESRALIEAKKRGCKLVVVDPAFTETAQKADEWIPIRPGTDGAMALAMCHEIIEGNLYDKAFVAQHCSGFDGFRDHLRERGYTPQWAEPICGVPAATIARLAREFAMTKPSMSAIFKGSGYYTNGADAGRACYILDAICGQVDGPGNLILKDWAPLAPPVDIPEEARGKPGHPALHVAMGYPLAPDLPNAQLPAAVLEGKPYPVKALECDVVLPETSFHEQAEIRNGMWMGPEVILCQPAVPPVGEARPPYEIAQGIARKMGWGEHFPYERWEDWAAPMLKDIPISLEELKEKGFWAGPVRYHKVQDGLPTPSGKVEIRSQAYADAGHDPYPVFVPRSVLPDDEYPLQVTHSKLSMHCNIVTQNNPLLMEVCPENWVEISATDAARYGVADGQEIVIESPKDRIRMKAKVTQGLVPGAISIRHGHGFGHWAMGAVAKGKGAHSNNLMDSYTNPITGGNCYNECKVRIRAAG